MFSIPATNTCKKRFYNEITGSKDPIYKLELAKDGSTPVKIGWDP
jgi:hypothetical protein